jgi:glycine cleavage system P protein (glycine dehydrogenase) subunit 1
MRYLPHTPEDIAAMLQVVGVQSMSELFSTVPDECVRRDTPDLPEPLTEWELDAHMAALSEKSTKGSHDRSAPIAFLGAGRYEHFIPESINYLLGRSEFSTAYTPYQPEMSQGTLQAIYEYQTLTARLLGLEVANASLYDGASALAEALLMAVRITRKKKVALSRVIHPHYRQVVQTYLDPAGVEITELPGLETGRTDISGLQGIEDLAAMAVQSPNFWGCIEDLGVIGDMCRENDILFITSFTEPLAYGMFRNPGLQGAHISCGEGQSLGIPRWFGGPGLGMFACKTQYMRSMPGRLVGQTEDKQGRRGFVLTLATREQHIRREKATSNICTNSSLCALTATMYMASLGGTGIRELARLNYDKAGYLKQALQQAGFRIPFDSPCFNEFVVEFPPDFEATHSRLLKKNMVAGLPLSPWYPELKYHYLLCVTEARTRAHMDAFVKEVVS